MITAERLQQNWEEHKQYVKTYLSSERAETILKFFDEMEEIIAFAPASSKEHWHNAFPGGYVDHVNRVVRLAIDIASVWTAESGARFDFTTEELVFSALFHDLGKIGDGEVECYQEQTDNWRRDKLGELYTINPELTFMLAQDRSLFILQKLGIPVTEKEYLGIKLHDGMFEDGNKAYYTAYNVDSKLRTSLPYILHTADFLAARMEYERWRSGNSTPTQTKPKEKKVSKKFTDKGNNSNLLSMVQNL